MIASASDTWPTPSAASKFIEGRSRHDLDEDLMLVFALARAVEIIGEAASKLSSEGCAELPAVPWSSIVGMRNRLIHAYFDVDRTSSGTP
jgi:uncharacterized protein with HEPN domain